MTRTSSKSPTALALAQIYVAEFMRLYEHYRARALWDWAHSGSAAKPSAGKKARKSTKPAADTFILKTTMQEWVKDAYVPISPTSIMRVNLAEPIARGVSVHA